MMDSVPGSVGDYAACIGTTGFDYKVPAHQSLTGIEVPPTGIFVAVTGRRTIEVKDGLSNTLLVGEKHVPIGRSVTYPWDCNLFDGHNIVCSTRTAGPGFPLASGPTDERLVFDGPHVGLCHFAFADGSVQRVRTTLSEDALGRLSHIADGLTAPSDY